MCVYIYIYIYIWDALVVSSQWPAAPIFWAPGSIFIDVFLVTLWFNYCFIADC